MTTNENIAIIGFACRMPGGCVDAETSWDMLSKGRDPIVEVPIERWPVDRFYDADLTKPGKLNSKWGGFLENVDQFDPEFFQTSPREADEIDPQQRIFLEVAWEAIESSGIPVKSLRGKNCSVFVGAAHREYYEMQTRNLDTINTHTATGGAGACISGRLAYLLGLRGPAITVDTACSSSMVAIHLACQNLRLAETDLAIAGGISLMLNPEYTMANSKAGMLSPDGRCRTFDINANGFVRSEVCGALVLKRFSEAERDGDKIFAVIAGSAINQDGNSRGLTVPNELAQRDVIQIALKRAMVTPQQVGYVETHGTGTPLGDPIELNALKHVYRGNRTQPLVLGALKSCIGHPGPAAGVASVIKVILSLQWKQIPPNLHFTELNPIVSMEDLSAVFPVALMNWNAIDGRRIAGISSFGMSGTNAHLILKDHMPPTEGASDSHSRSSHHLLCLSASTPSALHELSKKFVRYLDQADPNMIANICVSASSGRSHLKERLAVGGANAAKIRDQLVQLQSLVSSVGTERNPPKAEEKTTLTFVFSDQMTPSLGMGMSLYKTEAAFKESMDECSKILENYLDRPIVPTLFEIVERGQSSLANPKYFQPALFAFEYALCNLWRSWGIGPSFVTGHGLGELVAASVAGFYSLDDALRMVCRRGDLTAPLTSDGAHIAYLTPTLPMVSNLTGQVITPEEMKDTDYWTRYWRQPVFNTEGVKTLMEKGCNIFLEIGASETSSSAIEDLIRGKSEISYWRSSQKGKDDVEVLLENLGHLYCRGLDVDWQSFNKRYGAAEKVALPTYPFQRKRCWVSFKSTYDQQERMSAAENHGEESPAHEIPNSNDSFLQSLRSAQASDRFGLVLAHLWSVSREVLQLAPSDVTGAEDLIALGMDSMMATEIVSIYEKLVPGIEVQQTAPLKYPVLKDLAHIILESIEKTI